MPTPTRAFPFAVHPRFRGRLAAALLATLPASAACAIDLAVPGQFATLRAAIEAARDGDRILVAAGRYAGSDNVDLDFAGKAITLEGAAGPEQCIIDGSSTPGANALRFVGPDPVTQRVRGLGFVGFATTPGAEGAIRLVGHSGLQLDDCIFEGCTTAGAGGATTPGSAIALLDSQPVIRTCRFLGNVGSAVHLDADSTCYIIDSHFIGNVTRPTDGRGGGAVLNEGFMLTFDSFYVENRVEAIAGAAEGGAIHHRAGFLDLTEPTFSGNAVAGPGAVGGSAVAVHGGFVANGAVLLDQAGAADSAAFLVAPGAEPYLAFASLVCTDNASGGLRIVDPAGEIEVRLGGSTFCRNAGFDVVGPFVNWGGNSICCPADLDGSGDAGLGDLVLLLAEWGDCSDGCSADLDEDGLVGLGDLLSLLAAWGACPTLDAGG